MKHVFWIGGTPRTGKTTIAARLARRYGLRLYSADTRTWAHRDRAIREGSAAAIRWESMDPRERRSAQPADLVEISLHRQRGAMVVDDLRGLPTSPSIVAEGTTVSPSGVADRSRAVWLIAAPDFLRAQLDQAAHAELYALIAAEIERDSRRHAMPVLRVDGSQGIDDVYAAVEERFAGALATGPRAETLAERQALLREANDAVVVQVRDYYARPWAEGDAEVVVRSFLCECGDESCDAFVDAAVGEAAEAPVLAASHT